MIRYGQSVSADGLRQFGEIVEQADGDYVSYAQASGIINRLMQIAEVYRRSNRDHLAHCVKGRIYPGLGPMDDRCDMCILFDMLKGELTLNV